MQSFINYFCFNVLGIILVCSGCYNTISLRGELINYRDSLLTVLEVGSLRSGKDPLQVTYFSLYFHVVQRAKDLPAAFYKALIPFVEVPPS